MGSSQEKVQSYCNVHVHKTGEGKKSDFSAIIIST
uniref:Uncharacterized protein n=1 Tax=Anguilla anguilla TaxID=7936 RepID=A0A0E9U3D0_ANGAN